ncbi:hypothetical protein HanHA89_Chr10g0387101 [Helianthus annuus]|uniref:Uncharacterized protein n=1 Tax=Helianthus annuus TaxID=4232 RepID=A0A251TIY1_HELAN|nr:hypothetical protein HanHA89_Chr10g0387101 [Helianthus annuus]
MYCFKKNLILVSYVLRSLLNLFLNSRTLSGHPLDQMEYSESNPSPSPIPWKTW